MLPARVNHARFNLHVPLQPPKQRQQESLHTTPQKAWSPQMLNASVLGSKMSILKPVG